MKYRPYIFLILILILILIPILTYYQKEQFVDSYAYDIESQPFEINSVKYVTYPIDPPDCSRVECNNNYRGYICPGGFTTC